MFAKLIYVRRGKREVRPEFSAARGSLFAEDVRWLQASLGSLVENGKRSEHRDVSVSRLAIGFRLIDH